MHPHRMTRTRRDLTAPRKKPDTELMTALTQLVQQLSVMSERVDRDRSMPMASIEPDQVRLDVTIDGFRCVLMRCREERSREKLQLSPREHEIARMVMKGYPNKTIAAVLDISVWTVGTHLRRIFAKLNVGTRAAMVAELMAQGGGEGSL